MNITPLFGIPLYSRNIDVNNDLLHSYEDWTSCAYSTHINNGYRTNTNSYLNDHSYYSHLMSMCVEEYLYHGLQMKKTIGWRWTTSWGLRHDTGDYSSPHNHVNCMWSCILYTEVPENSGDLILMKDERPTWTTGTVKPDLEQLNNHTTAEVRLGTSNGLCVIFPGFLSHGSSVNKSEGSRYCVVCNIFVSGNIGSFDKESSELIL